MAVAVSGRRFGRAALAAPSARPRGAFSVAGLIHVNHQLRGFESDRDEAFCQALADRLALPAHIERIEVRRAAAAAHRSIEDVGRRARYAALERGRQALAADRVAVGHTRDDQAETVLLKLLRGAGPRGLAGIYPRKGTIVRPLLEVGRAQLRAWSADNQITHVEDASNEDVSNPRNLLRHQVLPALERWFGPAAPAALAQTAEIAARRRGAPRGPDGGPIRAGRAPGCARALDGCLCGRGMPLALTRRLLREALRRAGVPEPGFLDVEALRSVLDGVPSVDFAGRVRGDRNGRHVVLSVSAGVERASPFRYALPVPGSVWIAEAGRDRRSRNRRERGFGAAEHFRWTSRRRG